MALEKISISGISDVYAVSAIKKEFKKAVNQPWKNSEPYPEYQKKLLADLAVLDIEKEKVNIKKQELQSKERMKNIEIQRDFANMVNDEKIARLNKEGRNKK